MADDMIAEGSDPSLEEQNDHRKRKTDRACDFCRKRKTRCDGNRLAGRACSSCSFNDLDCTYHDVAVKRQIISKAYVESLEKRNEYLERRNKELEGLLEGNHLLSPSAVVDSPASGHAVSGTSTPTIPNTNITQEQMREIASLMLRIGAQSHEPAFKTGEAETEAVEYNPQDSDLTARMQHIHLSTSVFDRFTGNVYLGKSSTAHLISKLISLKKPPAEPYKVPATFLNGRRAPFWNARPWETALLATDPVHFVFPEPDLMATLVDLYFDNFQSIFPIFHRPSFERSLRNYHHITDHDFGALLLLVCALGAQHSDDPRVLSEEYGMELHTRGWQRIPTIADELWNRAAWVLIVLDRNISAVLGRSCAIMDEDLTIRYPMDVDDAHWYDADNPNGSWKQPVDKPSTASCFIASLKLSRIIEFAIRTIYGSHKYGNPAEFWGEDWARDVVQELDSALNQWLNDLPEHLRWNPEEPDHQLLNQAAFIHCAYRQAQILIHRPFLSANSLSPHSSLPSLAICTTAARESAHILDQQKRVIGSESIYQLFSASVSAIVLLVSMWTRSKSRSSREQPKELKDIHTLMDYVKALEDLSPTAGRMWDVLNEIRAIGDLPDSQLGKRPHDGAGNSQPRNLRRAMEDAREGPSPSHQGSSASLSEFGLISVNSQNGFSASGSPTVVPHNASAETWSSVIPSETEISGMTPWNDNDFGYPLGETTSTVNGLGSESAMGGMTHDAANEMSIWSSIPSAFDPSEWAMYLTALAEAGNATGRCDGDRVTKKSCSNCSLNKISCTFNDVVKRQNYSKAYVESIERRIEALEQRNQELENMLERHKLLSPSVAVDSPASAYADTSVSSPSIPSSTITTEQMREIACTMLRVGTQGHDPGSKTREASEKELTEFNPQDDELADRLRNIHLSTSLVDNYLGNRYLGKSSVANLVLKLISLKRPANEPSKMSSTLFNGRRAQYWSQRPWETALLAPQPVNYFFPDADLMPALIDLYFDHVQLYFPLLHRPTLAQGIRDLQHETDSDFGIVLLLVCALGAQHSDDPRVLCEEYGKDPLSRGWKWFIQAEKARKPVLSAPNLLEIQSHCLSVLFIGSASTVMSQHIWTRIGIAIRYLQDVGAHRRPASQNPTVTDELWIRAAWILVVLDRNLSSLMGRGCALSDEDLAIRYPLNVDDEYWHNPDAPEQSWKQPSGKPSKVSCFIASMKLSRIVEITIRTLYGSNKYGCQSDFWGEDWGRDVVRELDSALNKWYSELPEHLHWDPNQPDRRLLNQSPIIPAAIPSVADYLHNGGKGFAAYVSTIILLVNMWTRSRPQSNRERLKELGNVQLIMDYIKSMEDSWVMAGRTWDMLNEFRSVGDAPESQLGKRANDGTDDHRTRDSARRPPEDRLEGASRDAERSSGPMGPANIMNLQYGFADSTMPLSMDRPGHITRTERSLDEGVVPGSLRVADSSTPHRFGTGSVPFQQSAYSLGEMAPSSIYEGTSTIGVEMEAPAPDELNEDGMTIWSALPPSFDPSDWMAYFATLAEAGNEPDSAQPYHQVRQDGIFALPSFVTGGIPGPGENAEYRGDAAYSWNPS
ncbi:fungal-specific transcription factor domain-containing protein [Schizophyllum fasciatum]